MAAQAAINRLPSFLNLIGNSSDALDKPDLEDSGTMTKQLGANLAGDQPSMEQINKKRKRINYLDEDQSQESTTLTNKKRRAYHPIPKNHDWAELPEDALSIIFQKLGFFEVLVSAQQVCRSWRQVALDPSALCWRCIDMRCLPDVDSQSQDVTSCLIKQENFTKLAIDRSGCHVEDLCLISVNVDFLTCITNRTPRLRCCTLIWCYQIKPEGLFNFFSRCPLLEELHVYNCLFSNEGYKCIGLACPQLKCLHIDGILRKQEFHWDSEDEYDDLCHVGRKYPDYPEIGPDLTFEHWPKPNFGSIDDSVPLKIANNTSIPSRDSDLELYPDVGLDPRFECEPTLRFECEPTLNSNPEDDILALEITDNISIPNSDSNLDHYLDVGLDPRFESEPDGNFDCVDDSVAPEISDSMSIPAGDADIELYPEVGPDPIYEVGPDPIYEHEHEPALNSVFADDRVALEIADNMPQLRDLHLIRNFNLTNKGVHAILDKCLHLESLNISCCFDVHVDEVLQVKLTKIKSVRLSRRSQYHQQCN